MNELPNIFYCNVCNSVFDTHGKTYDVKEHRNWKFVNFNNKKIGLSSLPIKMKIFDFDDFVFAYIFGGLFTSAPCFAMDYLVYRKVTGKRLTPQQYKIFQNKR